MTSVEESTSKVWNQVTSLRKPTSKIYGHMLPRSGNPSVKSGAEITTLTRSPWLMRWGFGRRDISVSWTSYRWFKILYSHKPMHYNGTEINVMFIRLPTPNLNWFIPWWRSHNPRFSCITFLFVYLCQRWVLLSVVCLFVQTYLIDIFTFVWCD
jgi:hypothetical protein